MVRLGFGLRKYRKRNLFLFFQHLVASLVLVLQGMQATFLIVAGLDPTGPYHTGQGLPYVFLLLACLGLIRRSFSVVR
jgi:hypothetical protein